MTIVIAVIGGSVRPDNATDKALALVVDELQSIEDVLVRRVDVASMTLPLPGRDDTTGDASVLQEAVLDATGVVLCTPEYHGGVSSVMKLVLENLGFPNALQDKPIALLGVAAGAIGAIKSLEQLRSICSHVGAIVLPGPVSVAGVAGVFDENGACTDAAVEARIRGAGHVLVDYIRGSIHPRLALEAMVREDAERNEQSNS